MHASAVIQVLREALPGLEIVDLESNDTPTIGIGRDDLLTVFKTLRDHQSLQFALLVELTAVDRLPASPRFEKQWWTPRGAHASSPAPRVTSSSPTRKVASPSRM